MSLENLPPNTDSSSPISVPPKPEEAPKDKTVKNEPVRVAKYGFYFSLNTSELTKSISKLYRPHELTRIFKNIANYSTSLNEKLTELKDKIISQFEKQVPTIKPEIKLKDYINLPENERSKYTFPKFNIGELDSLVSETDIRHALSGKSEAEIEKAIKDAKIQMNHKIHYLSIENSYNQFSTQKEPDLNRLEGSIKEIAHFMEKEINPEVKKGLEKLQNQFKEFKSYHTLRSSLNHPEKLDAMITAGLADDPMRTFHSVNKLSTNPETSENATKISPRVCKEVLDHIKTLSESSPLEALKHLDSFEKSTIGKNHLTIADGGGAGKTAFDILTREVVRNSLNAIQKNGETNPFETLNQLNEMRTTKGWDRFSVDPALKNQFNKIYNDCISEISKSMTAKTTSIYSQLSPEELINSAKYAPGTTERETACLNLIELNKTSTRISDFISAKILSHDDLNQRAFELEKWIDIGHQCLMNKDFQTADSIFLGLNKNEINRLKKTWAELSPKTLKKYESLEKEISDIAKSPMNQKDQQGIIPLTRSPIGLITKLLDDIKTKTRENKDLEITNLELEKKEMTEENQKKISDNKTRIKNNIKYNDKAQVKVDDTISMLMQFKEEAGIRSENVPQEPIAQIFEWDSTGWQEKAFLRSKQLEPKQEQ